MIVFITYILTNLSIVVVGASGPHGANWDQVFETPQNDILVSFGGYLNVEG